MGTQRFKPEELSAFVLRQLLEDARRYLGEDVEEAVISVPAYCLPVQGRPQGGLQPLLRQPVLLAEVGGDGPVDVVPRASRSGRRICRTW